MHAEFRYRCLGNPVLAAAMHQPFAIAQDDLNKSLANVALVRFLHAMLPCAFQLIRALYFCSSIILPFQASHPRLPTTTRARLKNN
jgi:hypothetical protein